MVVFRIGNPARFLPRISSEPLRSVKKGNTITISGIILSFIGSLLPKSIFLVGFFLEFLQGFTPKGRKQYEEIVPGYVGFGLICCLPRFSTAIFGLRLLFVYDASRSLPSGTERTGYSSSARPNGATRI